ncbi:MAG: amidohydrolase family protein [Bacteroidia bacterium]
MKIDMHTHILPEKLPKWTEKFGYGGFVSLEHKEKGFADMMIGSKFFRRIEENCWSPEKRLEDNAKFGIDLQVICTIPVMFAYWAKIEHAIETSRFLNDHIAEICQKYPNDFAGLATIPLQDPDAAIAELERCVNELGYVGIQIGTHVNQWNLNAPELFPVFKRCQELNACVLIHPWDMMGSSEMPQYWLPWLVGMPAEESRAICSMIFGGVFERLPNLRVAFAHGGGAFAGTIGRIEHGFNSRPDLVAVDNPINPREYLGKFWVDAAVFDEKFLHYIVDLYGANRVCLGSDYPFPLGEWEPGKMIETSSLSPEIKQQLLGQSALAWMGKVMNNE